MSKTVKIICDRCGKEIMDYDVKFEAARIRLWGAGVLRTSPGQIIDLCNDCCLRFIAFLERSE